MTDFTAREELRGKYEYVIEHGIASLTKCLEIDTGNEDAMDYMNLLLREKAFLEDSAEETRGDIAQAETWSNKSREMRRTKTSRAAKQGPGS